MSTLLRVLRGAIEKFGQYNEELPLRRIVVLKAEPSIRKPTGLARPLRSDITAENICNEESLLETRVEESFLSGINFFYRSHFLSTNFAKHLVCLLSLSPSSYLF